MAIFLGVDCPRTGLPAIQRASEKSAVRPQGLRHFPNIIYLPSQKKKKK
jgi:hypothetical protein